METNETPVPQGEGGTTEKPEQFTIQTKEHGEWYLRKLANLEAEKERTLAQAALMLRQLENDRSSLVSRYESQFQNLVRTELEASKGKRKSVVFFNGTAGFRTVAPRLVVSSEADLVTTARAVLPSAFTTETVEKFDKAAFRVHATKYFEDTGEILPGLERTEERQEFTVKFPAKKGAAAEVGEEGGDA